MEKVNLSNIRSCSEVWEDMPVIEGGRLCSACNKCITDFRNASNYEIAYQFAFSEEAVCGIYRPDQLEQWKRPRSDDDWQPTDSLD